MWVWVGTHLKLTIAFDSGLGRHISKAYDTKKKNLTIAIERVWVGTQLKLTIATELGLGRHTAKADYSH